MRKIVLSTLMVFGFATAAQASSFVWKDQVNGFTFSFPDTWAVQTEESPSMRIRIASPSSEDRATCSVKTEKDGRLKIYPKHLMSEAVDETLDKTYWQDVVAEHEEGTITDYRAPSNLGGKGDATAVKVSYVENTGDKQKAAMHAAMIGSIYGDTRYVISCASRAEVYDRYAPLFATIIASVDLDSRYQPFATGYYRDFLSDPVLALPRTKPGTILPKNKFALKLIP